MISTDTELDVMTDDETPHFPLAYINDPANDETPGGLENIANLYRAFNNDPINFDDPDGLSPQSVQPTTQPSTPATQPATQPAIPPFATIFQQLPRPWADYSYANTKIEGVLTGSDIAAPPTLVLPPELESALQESLKQVQAGLASGNADKRVEWGGGATKNPDGTYSIWAPQEGTSNSAPLSATIPQKYANNGKPVLQTVGFYHVHTTINNFSGKDLALFLGAATDVKGEKNGMNFGILMSPDGKNTWVMVALANTQTGSEGFEKLDYGGLLGEFHVENDLESPKDSLAKAMENEQKLAVVAQQRGFALYARHAASGPLTLVTPKK